MTAGPVSTTAIFLLLTLGRWMLERSEDALRLKGIDPDGSLDQRIRKSGLKVLQILTGITAAALWLRLLIHTVM